MKTIFSNVIVFISLMVLFTSCVHYYYAPNSNNVPLFKEKNEGRIQAQYSTVSAKGDESNSINGFELQTAYSFSRHEAVQVNFFHAGDNEKDYGSGYGNYIEAAAGYFKPLQSSHFIFETYSGAGIGSVKNYDDDSHSYLLAKTSITKFFIQPSLGFSSRDIDIAFSSKFSLIDIGVHKSNVTLQNNISDYDDLEAIKNGNPFIHWEPGLMFRGGFKQLKFFAQFTYSAGNKTEFPIEDTNVSFGIIYLFKIKSK